MNSNQTKTKETLIELLSSIAPEADLDALGEDEDIRQTLGIDSYDFLNLMIAINESFGVEIPERDYGKLISLADLILYLEAHSR